MDINTNYLDSNTNSLDSNNDKQIINTIKKYLCQFDKINDKIYKVYITYYLFLYLYNNIDFVIKHPKFKIAVINKINEIGEDVISMNMANCHSSHQLIYFNNILNIIDMLNNKLID